MRRAYGRAGRGHNRRPGGATGRRTSDRRASQRRRAGPAPRAVGSRSTIGGVARVLGFPDVVDEKAARVVAAGVVLLGALALLTQWHVLTAVIAVGFLARVLTGPTLSPLGRLASRVIAPRLGPERPTPGPPKRFAQAIGLVVSTLAATFALALGWVAAANALLAALVLFATLEAALGLCVGCRIFGVLMRVGLVPRETCEACADIWSRPGAARA